MTPEEIIATVQELEAQIKAEGDYENVEARLTTLLAESILPNSPGVHSQILIAICSSLHSRGQSVDALPLAEQAFALAIKAEDTSVHARACFTIGSICWRLSDHHRALEYSLQALSMYEHLDSKSGVAATITNIGLIYQSLADYPRALEFHQKAVAMCEEHGNLIGQAVALGNVGLSYRAVSEYTHALEYLQRALSVSEEVGDADSALQQIGNIGSVYLELHDYPRALLYIQKAVALAEERGNRLSIANYRGGLAGVYIGLSDYPRALEELEMAKAITEELGYKGGTANHTGNMAEVYYKLSDFTRTLEYLQKALSLSDDLGSRYQRVHWLLGLGELYANARFEGYHVPTAEGYLRKALSESETLGVQHIARDSSQELYKLYRMQERWKDALEMKEKVDAINAHINIEDVRKKAEQAEVAQVLAEREKQIIAERSAAAARISEQEKLLHQILPAQIAERLLKGERIADYYQMVSILFADIVGFTPIAARMPARGVIAFLNHVFAEFDAIMKKNGCEKIKTIGDGYMALAGAPIECSDHAERIARAALEMMNDINLPDEIRITLPKDCIFNIRIGLHCGSAFGGIVGTERFVYDVYSDAVNIASRMESSGEPGKIHCSEEFAYHLQNRDSRDSVAPDFHFRERGETEIKGKGLMRTYFLERV